METINKLEVVADLVEETDTLEMTVVNFANAVTSLDVANFNNPEVMNLVTQISTLFLELFKLTN